MRHLTIVLAVTSVLAGLIALTGVSVAEHDLNPRTMNMRPRGHSPFPATFSVPDGERKTSSDIAFQGGLAFQGNYSGFRVIDISQPQMPKKLAHVPCNGDQGDLVVWDNILIRTWNTKRGEDRQCGFGTVPAGFEGLHVWDISTPEFPVLVGSLELPCGSHTATAAGVDGGDLIIYSNNSSSSGCGVGLDLAGQNALGDFMDIIAVPLDNPGALQLIDREPLAGPTDPLVRTGCSDAAVILGSANKAACASADTINVWDITNKRDPSLLFTITEPGVGDSASNGRWRSVAFTWDGEVIVAGWEPGGGGAAECEAGDPDLDKSMFFYDADGGSKLGQWVLPRDQGADENCAGAGSFNVVPLKAGRYMAVSGNYQAGTWVVDFSDPANPETVGWSDPESLGTGPFCGGMCQIGGAWASYWYNNFIYESDITRGLNVFRLNGPESSGARKLPRLNPQTQEFTID